MECEKKTSDVPTSATTSKDDGKSVSFTKFIWGKKQIDVSEYMKYPEGTVALHLENDLTKTKVTNRHNELGVFWNRVPDGAKLERNPRTILPVTFYRMPPKKESALSTLIGSQKASYGVFAYPFVKLSNDNVKLFADWFFWHRRIYNNLVSEFNCAVMSGCGWSVDEIIDRVRGSEFFGEIPDYARWTIESAYEKFDRAVNIKKESCNPSGTMKRKRVSFVEMPAIDEKTINRESILLPSTFLKIGKRLNPKHIEILFPWAYRHTGAVGYVVNGKAAIDYLDTSCRKCPPKIVTLSHYVHENSFSISFSRDVKPSEVDDAQKRVPLHEMVAVDPGVREPMFCYSPSAGYGHLFQPELERMKERLLLADSTAAYRDSLKNIDHSNAEMFADAVRSLIINELSRWNGYKNVKPSTIETTGKYAALMKKMEFVHDNQLPVETVNGKMVVIQPQNDTISGLKYVIYNDRVISTFTQTEKWFGNFLNTLTCRVLCLQREVRHIHSNSAYAAAHFLFDNFNTVIVPKFDVAGKLANDGTRSIGATTARLMAVIRHDDCIRKFREVNRKFYNNQRSVIIVDESWSSKQCSRCGDLNVHIGAQVEFDCKRCGYVAHRDLNAAINIAIRGCVQCMRAHEPKPERSSRGGRGRGRGGRGRNFSQSSSSSSNYRGTYHNY
jgi:hypothetical protein